MDALWVLLPTGQRASGEWIDDTLRARVEEKGLLARTPRAGQFPRQRVELVRALGGETDLLLMDEPFSSLDYLARLRMRAELARLLREQPRTVVLVTHDIEEAAQLADRVLLLSDRPGRVRDEVSLDLPRPREATHPGVVAAVHRILTELGLETER